MSPYSKDKVDSLVKSFENYSIVVEDYIDTLERGQWIFFASGMLVGVALGIALGAVL